MSSLKGLSNITKGLSDPVPEQINPEDAAAGPPDAKPVKRRAMPSKRSDTDAARLKEIEAASAAKEAQTSTARKIGKSRDPQYETLTVYVRKSTKKAVELRLLREDHRQELSELVEELLSNWALSGLAS